MGKTRNAYRLLMGKPKGERLLRKARRRWVDSTKMDVRETGWGVTDRIDLAKDRGRWRALMIMIMDLQGP
jgi:hypothetical protein